MGPGFIHVRHCQIHCSSANHFCNRLHSAMGQSLHNDLCSIVFKAFCLIMTYIFVSELRPCKVLLGRESNGLLNNVLWKRSAIVEIYYKSIDGNINLLVIVFEPGRPEQIEVNVIHTNSTRTICGMGVLQKFLLFFYGSESYIKDCALFDC